MENELKFLFAVTKINAILTRRFSGHGLDLTDFIILSHLNDAPEQRLRRIDLANQMGLTASGITRMLLPLEKLGIIARDQNSEDDARARYTTLTKAGKTLLQDATASMEMKIEDIFAPADKKQIQEFTKFLEITTENLLK